MSVYIPLDNNQIFNELGLIVIPVAITGIRDTFTFDFLLDTGAQKTVLGSDVQKLLTINTNNESIGGGGLRGSSQYRVGTLNGLSIGSRELGSLDVLIGDFQEQFKKHNIEGILGADVLQKLLLVLDYQGKLLLIS